MPPACRRRSATSASSSSTTPRFGISRRRERRLRTESQEASTQGNRRSSKELLELVHLSQFADRLPAQVRRPAAADGPGPRAGDRTDRAVAGRTVRCPGRQCPQGAAGLACRLHDEVHVTTVFVTHDQEEALEVADRIVVINQGRIEQIGPPRAL